MKLSVMVGLVFLLLSSACDKDENTFSGRGLEGTQWKVLRIVDKTTGKVDEFPSEAKNFELIFRTGGKLNLLNMCNYSYGKYLVSGSSLQFQVLGPATEMYCGIIAEFEEVFLGTLSKVKEYKLLNKQLVLSSELRDVVMEYVGEYDLSMGKALFCTNTNIMNCLFEIEIFIEDKKMGMITTASQYDDIDCNCSSPSRIGMVFPLKAGTYKYTAKNLKCKAVNATNEWEGTLEIKRDECTTVFLNVAKK